MVYPKSSGEDGNLAHTRGLGKPSDGELVGLATGKKDPERPMFVNG
jgi:hypothetical protein